MFRPYLAVLLQIAGSSPPELKGPLKHPHSDSVSSASEATPTVDACCRSEVFEMSMSSQKSTLSSSPSEPTTSEPTTFTTSSSEQPTQAMATTSDPIPSDLNTPPTTSEPTTLSPLTSEGGHSIGKRSEGKKLSKKEKKFQLSKDDGKYAELNPINPHDAQKEFGNTLRLNPVGPAFGGMASLEESQVITTHNTSVPGPQGGEYVLYTF